MSQLAGLEYETSETGAVRIAVPERVGHDDLAMSLALASLPVMETEMVAPAPLVLDSDDLFGDDEGWHSGISLY